MRFRSQIKIHRRGNIAGMLPGGNSGILVYTLYFPLAAPINGHPVYAMPVRIGACSYRADIRYSFSLSRTSCRGRRRYPSSHRSDFAPAVKPPRRCGHDMKLNETHCPWADPIGSCPRTHERRLSLPVDYVLPMIGGIDYPGDFRRRRRQLR